MSTAAKTTDIGTALRTKIADGDVLHFLTRTLQSHCLDGEPRDVLAKLQTLKAALDQQETTLSRWPESSSKDRICAALAKAKNLVAQIVDEFPPAGPGHSETPEAKALRR